MKLLLRFGHGLGDNAQFAIVLKHLKKYHPDWNIDIEVPQGTTSFFTGLCRNADAIESSILKSLRIAKYCSIISAMYGYNGMKIENTEEYTKKYDQVIDVSFSMPKTNFDSVPSTKTTECITETFHMEPIKALYQYQVNIIEKDRDKVDHYTTKILKGDFAIIHYIPRLQVRYFKSFEVETLEKICKKIIKNKLVPVILDWKNESSLPDQKAIFCPERNHWLWEGNSWAEAGRLAALIERAKLYIGIDSGPTHIAGTTKTPSIAVWTTHHPINYYDGMNSNVLHLLPNNADDFIHSQEDREVAIKFFKKNYKYLHYRTLETTLLKVIGDKL